MEANDRKETDHVRRTTSTGLPMPLLVGGGIIAVALGGLLLLPSADSARREAAKPAASGSSDAAPGDDSLPSAEIVEELRIRPADGGAADADSPTRPRLKADDVAVFMRAKLGHSQDAIEGLAMEDFDAIYRAAHDLSLASQASTWEVLLTEEYARQSAEFRRSCESLRKAARDENLDAAALAWMDVTMKCVQCHKYVRSTEDTGP